MTTHRALPDRRKAKAVATWVAIVGCAFTEDEEPEPPAQSGLAYIDRVYDPNAVLPSPARPRHPDDTDCKLNLYEQHAWAACMAELERHPH